MIDLPPMDHQQTVELVSRCGVPRSHIQITADDELQADVVSIAQLSQRPSEVVIRCINNATVPAGYYVHFEDGAQNEAFWTLVLADARQRAKLEGQQWLRDNGYFETMPVYDASRSSLGDYGREVEAHCGLEPGSAVEVFDNSAITFRQEFLESFGGPESSGFGHKFTCLRNVLAASNLAEGGVIFGFIGNDMPLESDSE